MVISFVICRDSFLPSAPVLTRQPSLPRKHADFHTIKHTHRNPNTFFVRCLIALLNGSESLCKADNCIARFGQGELLANTDTGSSAEGDIGPAWTETWISPSFWAEFIGIGPPGLFSAMDDIGWIGYSGMD